MPKASALTETDPRVLSKTDHLVGECGMANQICRMRCTESRFSACFVGQFSLPECITWRRTWYPLYAARTTTRAKPAAIEYPAIRFRNLSLRRTAVFCALGFLYHATKALSNS